MEAKSVFEMVSVIRKTLSILYAFCLFGSFLQTQRLPVLTQIPMQKKAKKGEKAKTL
jgi:hypothetical protein